MGLGGHGKEVETDADVRRRHRGRFRLVRGRQRVARVDSLRSWGGRNVVGTERGVEGQWPEVMGK